MKKMKNICLTFAVSIFAVSFLSPEGFSAGREREEELLSVLRSNASIKAKMDVCRELARVGTKKAVPVLADLLRDPKLSHMARYALEPIKDPVVDEVLHKALKDLKGKLLVGVIGSLGVRRYLKATSDLAEFLNSEEVEVAKAAARALGSFGTAEAADSLRAALRKARRGVRLDVYEGLLRCAEKLWKKGDIEKAKQIYDELRKLSPLPHHVKTAALRGAILVRGQEGVGLLEESIRSKDPTVAAAALRTSLEMQGRAVTKALCKELTKVPLGIQILLCKALGNRKDAAALPALISLAKKGRAKARVEAIKALGEIGDPKSVPVLYRLTKDWVEDVAKCAKDALIGMKGEGVDRALWELLKLSLIHI